MNLLTKLKEFDYNIDRIIIGDMDGREKSYIFKVTKKINELVEALENLQKAIKDINERFDSRIEDAEKKAAKEIMDAGQKVGG